MTKSTQPGFLEVQSVWDGVKKSGTLIRFACGASGQGIGIMHGDGLDPDQFRRHVILCKDCSALVAALDGGPLSGAIKRGLQVIEEEKRQQRHQGVLRRQESEWPTRVRQLRRRLGLTQQGLAERLGTSRNTRGRWERGRQRPRGIAKTVLLREFQAAQMGTVQ